FANYKPPTIRSSRPKRQKKRGISPLFFTKVKQLVPDRHSRAGNLFVRNIRRDTVAAHDFLHLVNVFRKVVTIAFVPVPYPLRICFIELVSIVFRQSSLPTSVSRVSRACSDPALVRPRIAVARDLSEVDR